MMHEFDQQLLLQCDPCPYDAALAESKGLAENGIFTPEYFLLHRRYVEALLDYLDHILCIGEMEHLLSQQDLGFTPARKAESVHQAHFGGNWQYFFLRSCVCVERLSPADMIRLLTLQPEDAAAYIHRTMPQVLWADQSEAPNMLIIFDPDGKMAPNCSLVLGLATSPACDEQGRFVNVENEQQKELFLPLLAQELKERFAPVLPLPVEIFLYT